MSFERKHCIVKSCNQKNTRKFSLPSDTEGAKLWLELLDRKDLENHRNTSNLRVCEAHFAPHMMTASGKRLVQWAIPNKITENEGASSPSQDNTEIQNSIETQTRNKKQKEKKKIVENIKTGIVTVAAPVATTTTASTVSVAATSVVTTNTIKPQIISINQMTNTNNVTEVLNFEIKDDVKSVIEKATIIKDGNIVGKIDGIDLNKEEVHTVIETLKVEPPQIITINSASIPTQTIQTIPAIQHKTNTTTIPAVVTASPLKTAAKAFVISEQNLNNSGMKKRKLIIHNHNKNKIRKSDLINLAQQAINEAKNPPLKHEDQFDLIGKRIAIDLRQMDGRQKAIAEKLVNDVIYYGKIGQLRETSSFNPFYSSAPTPVVSTAPTVIQTTVQSSNQQQHHQQQHNQQSHQQHHQTQHHTRQIQAATVTTPIVAAASASSQTITIPPVGSLITATPIVSTVQVAGTNQIIYTVSNQNTNASTISLNGQAEQATGTANSGQNDKCQWWSTRNIAYM